MRTVPSAPNPPGRRRPWKSSRRGSAAAALRATMLASHPDRGGSYESFIEAHAAYEAAQGVK
jgi:hypothetical protein